MKDHGLGNPRSTGDVTDGGFPVAIGAVYGKLEV